MSSPISIPAVNKSRGDSAAARSLPTHVNGSNVYIPVHRRNASSLPERSDIHAHFPSGTGPLPMARAPSPSTQYQTPHRNASADIPLASIIPQARTYSFAALLAFSSSRTASLSPSQHAQVAAHLPLMLRRGAPSPPSHSRSPARMTPAAELPQRKADAPLRRRRTGRKPAGAKARVPPSVGADVEERRRRTAYGAGWGWSPAERVAGKRIEFGGESWRTARVPVAAIA
ncbi:hypothetical protein C2E23DRAFT_868850 [Lenzites betulinus]|nr:hypothetical protein C2E23DRAFT_868850 [Lenzites betulinus]